MGTRSLPFWILAVALGAGCGGKSPKGVDAGGDRPAGDAASSMESGHDDAADAAQGGADAPDAGPGPDADAASAGDADASPSDATDARPSDATVDATDATPPPSGSPFRALAISTGVLDACVLLDNHRVKCWGENSYGALGLGHDRSLGAAAEMGNALPFVDLGTGRTATAIASGRYHTCALLDDGNVKCWGYRAMTGQPLVASQAGIGDGPDEMGDALPTLDLGGHKAVQIACGYIRSCALLDDGSLRCWSDGATRVPQAVALDGAAKVRRIYGGNSGVVALLDDGKVWGTVPAGPLAITISPGERAVALGGAMSALCAILDDGSIKCGSTDATPKTQADLAAVGVGMSSPICGLSKAGVVRCWGASNCAGRYPTGTIYWCPDEPLSDGSFTVALGQKAVDLTSGGLSYMCALLADGGVKCWTTYDQCPTAAGGADTCPVPPMPSKILGGGVDIVGTGASRKFGAWRAIDFGTHP